MKITVTMKDPDGVGDSVAEAVEDSIRKDFPGVTGDEREAIFEVRHEKAKDFLRGWMMFHEYLTVEFDTDAGTATVLKAR